MGSLSSLVGSELDVRVASAGAIDFSPLAGTGFPSEPLELEGHVEIREENVLIESMQVSGAGALLKLTGTLGAYPSLLDSELSFEGGGENLARWAALWPREMPRLPEDDFEVSGRARVASRGLEVSELEVRAGNDRAELAGLVSRQPGLIGSDLTFRVTGPDLSVFGELVDGSGLSAEPYEVEGRTRFSDDGYQLDWGAARVGEIEVRFEGRLGELPTLDGSDLRIEVYGPRLSDLAAYLRLPALPADFFRLSGRLRVEGSTYRLTEGRGESGGRRLGVSGSIRRLESPLLGDLEFEVSGPDIADLAPVLSEAGLGELPALPSWPYRASGGVRLFDEGIGIEGLAATVGDVEILAEGWLGPFPGLADTDLTLTVQGSKASSAGALAGIALPPRPFRLRGRIERLAMGTRFHDLRAEMGENLILIDGTLGDPPELLGTLLTIDAEGPDAALLAGLIDGKASDEPFELSGKLERIPRGLLVEGLRARLGKSDVSGWFEIDLAEIPEVRGELSSDLLLLGTFSDLLGEAFSAEEWLLSELDEGRSTDSEATPESDQPGSTGGSKLLIGDAPLRLDVLNKLNAGVRYSVAELESRVGDFSNLEISVDLRDGRLQVERAAVESQSGSSLATELTLVPEDDGYRLDARLAVRHLELHASSPDEMPEHAAPIDIRLEIAGSGSSPHRVASGADGLMIMTVGEGRLKVSALDLAMSALPAGEALKHLLDVLNPFRKSLDYTEVECAVIAATFNDGRVEVDPAVVRVREGTYAGSARIDLETEELDAEWITRPRRLNSLYPTMTDRFIKVGGTLSSPQIEAKPLEAVTTTGIAVATGGLSIVAEGLWKRLRSDKKVCKRALQEVEEILAAGSR